MFIWLIRGRVMPLWHELSFSGKHQYMSFDVHSFYHILFRFACITEYNIWICCSNKYLWNCCDKTTCSLHIQNRGQTTMSEGGEGSERPESQVRPSRVWEKFTKDYLYKMLTFIRPEKSNLKRHNFCKRARCLIYFAFMMTYTMILEASVLRFRLMYK